VSVPSPQFDELGQLAAALCDDEIAPQQMARLEELVRESPEAKHFFLEYVQLHTELYSDLAMGDRWNGPPAVPSSAERAASPGGFATSRLRSLRWVVQALAATLLLALTAWLVLPRIAEWRERGRPEVVAHLVRTRQADWAEGNSAPREYADLRSGQRLDLRAGLAEIVLQSGARLILDGPVAIELTDRNHAFLHNGRITAWVPPEAAGFTVDTPSVVLIDLGTEFGVMVDRLGVIEVQVFAGTIQVRAEGATDGHETQELVAGRGLRVTPRGAGAMEFQEVAHAAQRFVRTLPEPGAPSVATMSELVSQHPRLIHHYTFEGATTQEQYRDHRGGFPLSEVAMGEGRGRGTLRAVRGFDATTTAFAVHRSDESDNFRGVALQSEAVFEPPPEMTVELLLNLNLPKDGVKGAVFAALATRGGGRSSFFLAALEHGQLMQILSADASFIETADDYAFVPGHWYYVASNLRTVSGQTQVNTYAANLSRGERKLTRVVKDQLIAGVPAVGRLGVGKGFDANDAHAYPWSGDLDEVAIYDAVIDEGTLERHLQAIVGTRGVASQP